MKDKREAINPEELNHVNGGTAIKANSNVLVVSSNKNRSATGAEQSGEGSETDGNLTNAIWEN